MRFTIATAILAQALPALSQEDASVVSTLEVTPLMIREDRKREAIQKVMTASHQGGKRMGNMGDRPAMSHLIKNAKKNMSLIGVECKPDIGVLSCGTGLYCQSDDSSDLGGLCAPVTHGGRRKLDDEVYQCNLCGEDGMQITLPDATVYLPSAGNYVCGDLYYAAQMGLVSEQFCPFIPSLVAEACGCAEVSTDPTNSTTGDMTPTMSPTISSDTVPTAGSYDPCTLCPYGIAYPESTLKGLDGNVYTCNQLSSAAQLGYVNAQDCYITSLAAQSTCCFESTEVYQCNICGVDGMYLTLPDATVTIPSTGVYTCDYLYYGAQLGQIPEQFCGFVQSFAAEACGCEEGEKPTFVPDGGASPTPSPTATDTSGATSIVDPGAASKLVLTAVACAAVLLAL